MDSCRLGCLCASVTPWLRSGFIMTGVKDVCVYPQVRSDYRQQYASKVSDGMALQLGCLEIR